MKFLLFVCFYLEFWRDDEGENVSSRTGETIEVNENETLDVKEVIHVYTNEEWRTGGDKGKFYTSERRKREKSRFPWLCDSISNVPYSEV